MWNNNEFDLLLHEACRCDKSLKRSNHNQNESHFISVFTKLMLNGKVKAAVRWLSENSERRVLRPTDICKFSATSVMDVLKNKHPEPKLPPLSSLLSCDVLPDFEDLRITGAHIQRVASLIQGSAGPGGCDANHWQDALLRYSAHSEKLRLLWQGGLPILLSIGTNYPHLFHVD